MLTLLSPNSFPMLSVENQRNNRIFGKSSHQCSLVHSNIGRWACVDVNAPLFTPDSVVFIGFTRHVVESTALCFPPPPTSQQWNYFDPGWWVVCSFLFPFEHYQNRQKLLVHWEYWQDPPCQPETNGHSNPCRTFHTVPLISP